MQVGEPSEMLWLMRHILNQVTEEILSWLSALVALDHDTGDTNFPEIWMDNY